jgi:cyanate permease
MSPKINYDRRRFLGTVAMSAAIGRLGIANANTAEDKTLWIAVICLGHGLVFHWSILVEREHRLGVKNRVPFRRTQKAVTHTRLK